MAICVMARSSLHPGSPFVVGEADGQSVGEAYEGHLQQHRIVSELLEPALVAQVRVCEAEFLKAPGIAIDEFEDTEFLREPFQLTEGSGSLSQVDEMRLYPALGEEAERLPSIRAFLDAEDLDFHE